MRFLKRSAICLLIVLVTLSILSPIFFVVFTTWRMQAFEDNLNTSMDKAVVGFRERAARKIVDFDKEQSERIARLRKEFDVGGD